MAKLSDELKRKLRAAMEAELRYRIEEIVDRHFWFDIDADDLIQAMRKHVPESLVSDEDIEAIAAAIEDDQYQSIDVDVNVIVNPPTSKDPPTPLEDHLLAVRATRSGPATTPEVSE